MGIYLLNYITMLKYNLRLKNGKCEELNGTVSLNLLIESISDSSYHALSVWKIQVRKVTIAPGRFELPSSDSKSEMLVHYTTGLRLLYFSAIKNLS